MPLGETFLFTTCDYILWYGKDREKTRFRKLFVPRDPGAEGDFSYVALPDGTCRPRAAFLDGLPAGARLFQSMDLRSSGRTESCVFPFEFEGRTFIPSEGRSWKTNRAGMKKLQLAGRLFAPGEALRYRLYFDDYPVQELSHVWTDTQGPTDKCYVVQTSAKVVERCLLMTTDPDDLVLDPTCGGGTTAQVAEQWGRRWITIDTSRVALALTRTRLMSARFPSYQLADSSGRDLRRGFVYQQVPHVTLRSIANNPDIKENRTREQIDAAIRTHAESETLYDRPHEVRGVVRLAGPFTVEGLAPQRVLPSEGTPAQCPGSTSQFVHVILENLRKAGVQNTVAGQRLTFERLDWHPGTFVHAEGDYSENACRRRVRVSVGPEFDVVDADWVQQATREAMEDPRCDLLVVCGFAFDPHIGATAPQRKKHLRVLTARMSPDLAMGDDLLKKTGAGNLFLVFGEPDVAIKKQPDGRVTVEVHGLDVYDPTSGSVRSHGTDEIACWFLDTDHDGATFFVRKAYFCGGRPYERLQHALRTEIDEAEWTKLCATTSIPFAAPRSGNIAIKVINHYGDEVVKVYPVPSRPSNRNGK
jgi:adenine-specific DNA-methyltransferase